MRPAVLLDVDGVLNPLSVTCPSGYQEEMMDGDLVRWHADHGRQLLAVTAGRADLIWVTTWEDDANALLCPRLGLPALPVIELRGGNVAGTWKLDDVRRWAGAHRPVAWLDDELRGDAYRWAAGRSAPTLLLRTDAAVGVQPHHFQQLDRWLSELCA